MKPVAPGTVIFHRHRGYGVVTSVNLLTGWISARFGDEVRTLDLNLSHDELQHADGEPIRFRRHPPDRMPHARLMAMMRELHRAGYECLYLYSWPKPSGLHWRWHLFSGQRNWIERPWREGWYGSGADYTRDNSYLRFRDISSTENRIDFPDGTTQVFTWFGLWDWRLTRIEDRFGNWANVTYFHDPQSGELKSWKIQDQHGRTQTVNLVTASWYNQVVGSVVLTSFNGTTATWSFGYTQVGRDRAAADLRDAARRLELVDADHGPSPESIRRLPSARGAQGDHDAGAGPGGAGP